MKKYQYLVRTIILTSLVYACFVSSSFAESAQIDFTSASEGVIQVNYAVNAAKDTKIMIQKGNQVAFYPYEASCIVPLVFGSGIYNIGIYEHVNGDEYEEKELVSRNIVIEDVNKVFSQKTELVNWKDGQQLQQKAEALTSGLTTNEEKAIAVYKYLVRELKYDEDKALNVKGLYRVNPEAVFVSQKGICLDFSVLYASMLRSVGVPTKVLKGYKSDISSYHAWNQVFDEKTNSWLTVDITYDSSFAKNRYKTTFSKSAADYQVTAFY